MEQGLETRLWVLTANARSSANYLDHGRKRCIHPKRARREEAVCRSAPRMLPALVCAFHTPMMRPRLPLPNQLAITLTTEGQPVD